MPRGRPPRLWGAARRRALGLCGVFEAPRAVSAVSTLLTEGSGSGAKQQPPVTGKVLSANKNSANKFSFADPSPSTLLIGGLPGGQNASILTTLNITSHANLNVSCDSTINNHQSHGIKTSHSSSPTHQQHEIDRSDSANQECYNSQQPAETNASSFYRMCSFISETAATQRARVAKQIEPINNNHRVKWHFALSQHRDMFILITDKCASTVLHEGVRDGLIALLEHAEEELSCRQCIVAVPRNAIYKVSLLKVLMFLGFAPLSNDRLPKAFQEASHDYQQDGLMFVCYTFDDDI